MVVDSYLPVTLKEKQYSIPQVTIASVEYHVSKEKLWQAPIIIVRFMESLLEDLRYV